MALPNEDTAPIDLATGRRRPTGSHSTPMVDDDAPIGPHPSSTSDLLRSLVDRALTMGHRDRTPTPEESTQLVDTIHALAPLAQQAIQMTEALTRGGGTGDGGRQGPALGIITVAISTILALAVSIAAPSLFTSPKAQEAFVLAQASEDKAKQAGQRIDDIEAQQDKVEIALGKTIQWLGQEQYKACQADKDFAEAMNWMASRQRVKSGPAYEPIVIECDQSPTLPVELGEFDLRARRNGE